MTDQERMTQENRIVPVSGFFPEGMGATFRRSRPLQLAEESAKKVLEIAKDSLVNGALLGFLNMVGIIGERNKSSEKTDKNLNKKGKKQKVPKISVSEMMKKDQESLVNNVDSVVSQAERNRDDDKSLIRKAKRVLGPDFEKKLDRAFHVSQNFSGEITPDEMELAKIISRNKDLDGWTMADVVNYVSKEVIPQSFQEVWRKLGGVIVDVSEYQKLMRLSDSSEERILFVQGRMKTFFAAVLGAEGWDPMMLAGKDVRIVVDHDGKIVVMSGQQRRTIAPNLRETLTNTVIPNPFEAALAVRSGAYEMLPLIGIPLTRTVQCFMKKVSDVPGSLDIERSGAGGDSDKVRIPVMQVNKASGYVEKVAVVSESIRDRMTYLEEQNIGSGNEPYVSLSTPQLLELIAIYADSEVGRIPRARVVETAIMKLYVNVILSEPMEKLVGNLDRVKGAFQACGHDYKNAPKMSELLRAVPMNEMKNIKEKLLQKFGEDGLIMFAELLRLAIL